MIIEYRRRKYISYLYKGFTIGESYYPFDAQIDNEALYITQRNIVTGTDPSFFSIPVKETTLIKSEKYKENDMEEHKYHFICSSKEVDFDRILKEAPRKTPFILVEIRDRNHHPKEWALFIHNSILENPDLEGFVVGPDAVFEHVKTIGPEWGWDDTGSVKLISYRCISGNGKFPGYVKQQIEALRRESNEKDTLTEVSYL